MQKQVQSLGHEDTLGKEMATHSSILTGKYHGQKNLVGYSPWGHKELEMTGWLYNNNKPNSISNFIFSQSIAFLICYHIALDSFGFLSPCSLIATQFQIKWIHHISLIQPRRTDTDTLPPKDQCTWMASL